MTYFFTLTDFDGEQAHACDPTDYDGAVDAYAEQMDEGRASQVFRVDLEAGKAPMMAEVTDDANATVARRIRSHSYDMPQWLLEAA